MAKIIVTTLDGGQHLVDANAKFEKRRDHVYCTNGGYLSPIKESMEEIQKRINEAEAQATNEKLDLILKNQQEILKILKG